MEQAINKLAEMLGVGVNEVYTVLQSMAKVDTEMYLIGFWCCLGIIFLGFIGIIIGIILKITDSDNDLPVVLLSMIGIIVICIFSCCAFYDLRNYKMYKDNPKAYAIEKIFKSAKNVSE